jgi:hypothetical protein
MKYLLSRADWSGVITPVISRYPLCACVSWFQRIGADVVMRAEADRKRIRRDACTHGVQKRRRIFHSVGEHDQCFVCIRGNGDGGVRRGFPATTPAPMDALRRLDRVRCCLACPIAVIRPAPIVSGPHIGDGHELLGGVVEAHHPETSPGFMSPMNTFTASRSFCTLTVPSPASSDMLAMNGRALA